MFVAFIAFSEIRSPTQHKSQWKDWAKTLYEATNLIDLNKYTFLPPLL